MELPSFLPEELGLSAPPVTATEELFEASSYGGDSLAMLPFGGDYIEFATKIVLPTFKIFPPTRAKVHYTAKAVVKPTKSVGKLRAVSSRGTITPVKSQARYYA